MRDRHSLTGMVKEEVHFERSDSDLVIPGTCLRVHHPEGLSIDSSGHVLRAGAGEIHILYVSGIEGRDTMRSFLHGLDTLSYDRTRLYYQGWYKIDSLPVEYRYLRSTTEGMDELAFTFDDELLSTALTARFPASDTAARNALLRTMSSIYPDELTPADVEAEEPFTMDITHTEFLYTTSFGQIFLYTIGGKSNAAFTADQDQFFVLEPAPRPAMRLQDRADGLIKLYEAAQVRVLRHTLRRVFIREEEAYELEGDIQVGGKRGRLFSVIMGKPSQTLIFSACLYENVDQRLAEVIRIAQSLEFKNSITN